MSDPIHVLPRDRDVENGRQAVDLYREFERDERVSLMMYVAEYLKLWRDAHGYGITHCEGIMRLIDSLPVPWNKWADDASQPYLWYGLPTYVVQGDMHGFVKVLMGALVDACGGPPPYAAPPREPAVVHEGRLSGGRFERETPRPNLPKRRRLGMSTSTQVETEVLYVDRYVDVATYARENGENAEDDEEEEEEEEEEDEEDDPVEEGEPLERGTEVGNEGPTTDERAPE